MSRCKNLMETFDIIEQDDVAEDDTVINSIEALINTDFGKDDETQGKAVQLFRGLSFSKHPVSNAFMEDVSDALSKMDIQKYKDMIK